MFRLPVYFWMLKILFSQSSFATMNAEKFRSGPYAKEGVGGNLTLGTDLSLGNVQFFTIETSGSVGWIDLFDPSADNLEVKSFYFLTAGYQTQRNGAKVLRETSTIHARWTRMWVPLMGTEVFGQVQFDRLWNVNSRILLGGGGRLKVLKQKSRSIFVGAAAMLEHEVLSASVPTGINRAQYYARGSGYLAFQTDFLEQKLNWTLTTYYQPLLTNFTDLRVLIDTEVEYSLTKRFLIGVKFVAQHDSVPAPGILRNDLRWINKISFKI